MSNARQPHDRALIIRSRMESKLETLLSQAQVLHKMTLDRQAKKCLNRVVQNIEGALVRFRHPNTKMQEEAGNE